MNREPVEPYRDVASHLRDELARAWLRLEYQTRLSWTKGRVAATDDVIAATDIGRVFAAARGAEPAAGGDDAGAGVVLEQWLVAHRACEARIRATVEAGERSPLVDLIRRFGLTPRQWSTLMFALLPEADPNLVQAYRYLARDESCRGLDGRLLAQLVYDTPTSRSLMARDLSPSSPLLRYRLLDLGPAATPGDSTLFRRLRAATRLVYLLDGTTIELDPELADLAELRRGSGRGEFPAVTLDHATAALRSAEVILAVQGQRGLGKKLLLEQAAARWEQRILVLDGRRLHQLPPSAHGPTLRAVARELILLDALPVFADLDDVAVLDGDRDALPPFFDALLAEWSGPVAITINRERMPRIHQRPLVHLALEVPNLGTRTAMWRDVVPSLAARDAESLSGRFAIPGGVIVAAAQAATAGRMPDAGPPVVEELAHAVAAQLHQRISRLGKKLPTPFDIDDLVVDDDTRAALLEIAAAARERRRIRDAFKLRGAQGISVLFSGHPGVGKTMSGTVLARRLGLDIYEVDLSQVVSKWLGETEKNLSDVFDAAEPGHVVLLFNEADSLFGKRTADVKSSNDRYANLETNYLLQRLERFGGLAILTTNLTSAIDQAFKRRFTYDVFFSFPSPDMRAELWRRTLPSRTRTAPAASEVEIDFDALAEKFELSGGFIKVACERAAYVAGANDVELDEPLLRATIERMYRERGKLSTVGPLE
ncbi:MAG: AAA family ATPase [Deltaproteobacteria bacterium]|nr:AAA family ATPase [Deltaproteobacteria bacterium]